MLFEECTGVTTPLQSLLASMFNMLHESRLTELNASDQCTLNHIYDAVTIGLGNGINECMVSLSFSFKSFARHQGAMGQLDLVPLHSSDLWPRGERL